MTEERLINKLESAGIRPTAVRLMIGRLLYASDHPMSGFEIEQALDTVDRSTITRTVALFYEKGLLHLVEDGSGASKYEICEADHNEKDSDRHIHFHCTRCGRTMCLHSIPIPSVSLPSGFIGESVNFTVSGLCDKCSNI